MGEEIQKFDPAAAVDKLRDRVRAMFADIFPPEQLDAMIKREFTAWMTPSTRAPDSYNDRRMVEVPSGFQTIVRSVLEAETKTKLSEHEQGSGLRARERRVSPWRRGRRRRMERGAESRCETDEAAWLGAA
jgi:hypothetical protein